MTREAGDLELTQFEIRALGKRFGAAILTHAQELDEAVRVTFGKMSESGELKRIVEAAAREALAKAVKEAVDSYEVRRVLTERCVEALKK